MIILLIVLTIIITIRVIGNIELLDDTIYQLTKDNLIEEVKEMNKI